MPYDIGNRVYYKISEVESSLVVDLREIQVLLNHGTSKAMEIYTHVVNRSFMDIKDLLS